MSYIPEEYTPTEEEIDDVMSIYNKWLDKAYDHHGEKETAIELATNCLQNDWEIGRVFSWIAENDASRIYDVDGTLNDEH